MPDDKKRKRQDTTECIESPSKKASGGPADGVGVPVAKQTKPSQSSQAVAANFNSDVAAMRSTLKGGQGGSKLTSTAKLKSTKVSQKAVEKIEEELKPKRGSSKGKPATTIKGNKSVPGAKAKGITKTAARPALTSTRVLRPRKVK